MNGEDKFKISQIEPRTGPLQTPTPQKKGAGLVFLFAKKNLPKTITVLVIVAILIAVGAIIWGRNSFSKTKVELNIEVSEDIASGEDILVTVNYKNNNRVNLNDAQLIIDYPLGTFSLEGKEIFQEQKSLGIILRKSQGKEEFKVRFIGEKEDIKNLTAKLNYRPQNINSRFENTASLRTEITSVLIKVNVEGSEKVISGHEVNYLIEYENKTDDDVSDLQMRINYSDDFEFTDSDPKPIEETNNVWNVGLLKSDEKKEIKLKGSLTGNEGESKILEVIVGRIEDNTFLQYSKSEYVTQIAPSPLLLLLNIRGIDEEECNIYPGKRLDYELEFKNNTDVVLEELILKLYFDDSVFDFRTLGLGEIGSFDSRQNAITWSGGEVDALNLLEPNQSGEVGFSVQIKDNLPIFNYHDKNFRAKVSGEIETLTVPSKFSVSELRVENRLSCKINSELGLRTKVYYYEPEQGIINTGPIPPKVDKLTTYTVHWQVTNTSNDVENVKVSAILPQGVIWSDYYKNKVENSEFYYNERTKEIVWEINEIPSGVGVVLPIYELIFQIGIRPTVNQIGDTPTLINESSIEGRDLFTEVLLKDFTPEVNTSLPDDPKAGSWQGRVKE